MLGKIRKLFSGKKGQSYKCTSCGKVHPGWQALAYKEPVYYSMLQENKKKEIAQLSTDLCIIDYDDQTDFFIRGVLFQKINDACEELNYGPWVSLSKTSFDNYKANYNNEDHKTVYFGWLSNTLEGYENTLNIPCNVVTKTGNSRPQIIPHESFDHVFVADYYNGITKAEAEKRISNMMAKFDR